ncbi:hypothetical protein P153DRAFT_225177 [Dothidotthia symphoricarpi CBS 119687]|uniref:Uncharacterized protein n=1 Tax=Dothidotthia symphoricarpi CBS 119687 TaxID=1392245 RepID=A0A6A6AFX5_9PLEO|nr:uncharacterized protein P153DRAFT_225177 [Dothidotthia symphoricarpi CBS 119687]KAF2129837.1 hypothetical protein P153DRAFT_225177 [Dothidotthia symphoricarpi CBS 119687]
MMPYKILPYRERINHGLLTIPRHLPTKFNMCTPSLTTYHCGHIKPNHPTPCHTTTCENATDKPITLSRECPTCRREARQLYELSDVSEAETDDADETRTGKDDCINEQIKERREFVGGLGLDAGLRGCGAAGCECVGCTWERAVIDERPGQ